VPTWLTVTVVRPRGCCPYGNSKLEVALASVARAGHWQRSRPWSASGPIGVRLGIPRASESSRRLGRMRAAGAVPLRAGPLRWRSRGVPLSARLLEGHGDRASSSSSSCQPERRWHHRRHHHDAPGPSTHRGCPAVARLGRVPARVLVGASVDTVP
jgi:hypothetical protein